MTSHYRPPGRLARKWRKFRDKPIAFFADSSFAPARHVGLWGIAAYDALTSLDTATVTVDRIVTSVRRRSLKLKPINDVKAENSGWRCSSVASQFAVAIRPRLPRSRWKIVTLELKRGGSQLNAILGIDAGNGYVEGGSIQFPKIRQGAISILTTKELEPAFLRFSPMIGAGNFKLKRLEIRPVSVFGAISFLRKVEKMPLSEALNIVKDPKLLPQARLRGANPTENYTRPKWCGRDFPAFAKASNDRDRKNHYYNLVRWSEVKFELMARTFGILDNDIAKNIDNEIEELHGIIFDAASKNKNNTTVIVYTCNFNEYDDLVNPDVKIENTRYICFTDNPDLKSNIWEIVVLDDQQDNPRRTSRLPKLLPHKYLPNHDFSIYLDGTLKLRNISVKRLISECLGEAEIGLYPHHARTCLYDEALYCVAVEKEKQEFAVGQTKRYRKAGFPARYGLFENAFIVRKNTARIRELNELWWNEYISGSQRDQLSLMYCLWTMGIQANPIPFGKFSKIPLREFQ